MSNKICSFQIKRLIEHCLKQPGAYEDFPFGPEPLVIKVCGKMFALFYNSKDKKRVTLKCAQEFGDFMKKMYPGAVVSGYHFPPVSRPYFITVSLDGRVPEHELLSMICHAHSAAVAKLTKKQRSALESKV